MIIQRKLIDSRLLIYDVCQRITNSTQHEIKKLNHVSNLSVAALAHCMHVDCWPCRHTSALCVGRRMLRQLRPVTGAPSLELKPRRQLFICSSIHNWTTVTLYYLASLSWQPSSASSGCTTRRSTPRYWYWTTWAHHVGLDATSLAIGTIAYWI